MKLAILALLLVAGFSFSAQAEEQQAQNHQQHHTTDQGSEKKPEGVNQHGMMGGKMDMGQMHAMMGDCMKMHKDGKMCEGQMMEQCQKNMGKEDCSKMMKKAKAHKSK